MEELLKSLQKKCRVECEEAHRQLVCALNGLAGIHIIRGMKPQFPMGISWDGTEDTTRSLCSGPVRLSKEIRPNVAEGLINCTRDGTC